MFKKILIVYSEKLTNKHLETLEKVKNLVNGMNCLITKSHELNEVYFEGIDLVITIGGDGTFIRAATFLKDSLILGINSEPEYSEGALTSIKENELDLLKEILDGK
jgi:NAD kinase